MSMGDSPAGRGSLGVTDLLQAAQVRHYYDTVTAFSITAYTITAYTITTSLLHHYYRLLQCRLREDPTLLPHTGMQSNLNLASGL